MRIYGTERGMSLIELLTVIVIIAIMAGFVSVSKDLIRRERVASITRELYADLQRARLDSMTKDSQGFGVRFESSNAYTIFQFNDCNGDYNYDSNTCAGGGREEIPLMTKNMPSSVELKKTNPSTDCDNKVLIFDRFGLPRRDTGGLGMMTIVVKNEPDSGLIKCVSVSTNRIREGLWGWDKKERRDTCIEQ
ncbi:MAG: prepilin-type N-terminal cleavage/methylation domain-containing protein [Nitrospirota bacterium]|mgnify:CR=1 FL=1